MWGRGHWAPWNHPSNQRQQAPDIHLTFLTMPYSPLLPRGPRNVSPHGRCPQSAGSPGDQKSLEILIFMATTKLTSITWQRTS